MPDNTNDILAAAAQRTRRLMEQLAAAPLVELYGLVGSTGGSLGRFGQASLWTLILELSFWREAMGKLQARPLYLRCDLEHEQAVEWQKRIQIGAVMKFKARVVMDSVFARPEGLLVEIIGSTLADSELNDRALEQQRPVYHDDAVLGRFTLDRAHGWFEARADWLGQSVALRISVDERQNAEMGASTAHHLWEDQNGWDEQVRRCATDEMLPLKNQCWLEENEANVSAENFSQRLVLESIHIELDKSFSFWFGDDDLFGGHSVEVSGTLNDGPMEARMQG